MLQAQIAVAYGPGRAAFSALALAALGLAATIPTLAAAVVSGTLADRYDRRRLMILVDGIALGATGIIAGILMVDPQAAISVPGPAGFTVPVWLLLVFPIWAALTAAVTIFRPAFNAALPRLVEVRELGLANGLLYAFVVAASAATQLLTGFLVDRVGPAEALAVAVVLFAAPIVALARWEGPSLGRRRSGPERSFLRDATEGYRFLGRRRELLVVTLGSLAINFLSALAFVELAQYSAFDLGQGATFLGALYGVGTIGAGLGALAINYLPFERHLGRLIAVLTCGMGLTVAGFAVIHLPALALLDMFLFGMFPGMIQTGFLAGVQATVPNELLGRVFAADEVGSYAFVPVGQYAGGTITFAAGIASTYLVAGAGMAAVGVVLLLLPVVGRFRFDPADRPLGDAPAVRAEGSLVSAPSRGSDPPPPER